MAANTPHSSSTPLGRPSPRHEQHPDPTICFFWYHTGRCSRAHGKGGCQFEHRMVLNGKNLEVQAPPGYVHREPCALHLCPIRTEAPSTETAPAVERAAAEFDPYKARQRDYQSRARHYQYNRAMPMRQTNRGVLQLGDTSVISSPYGVYEKWRPAGSQHDPHRNHHGRHTRASDAKVIAGSTYSMNRSRHRRQEPLISLHRRSSESTDGRLSQYGSEDLKDVKEEEDPGEWLLQGFPDEQTRKCDIAKGTKDENVATNSLVEIDG